MSIDYISFNFGRKDGTILSADDFFKIHGNIKFTNVQKRRMMENLETQGILIVKGFPNSSRIIITDFYSNFVFEEPESGELYLKPLYETGIGVFFIKEETPKLLIYDMRKIDCNDN